MELELLGQQAETQGYKHSDPKQSPVRRGTQCSGQEAQLQRSNLNNWEVWGRAAQPSGLEKFGEGEGPASQWDPVGAEGARENLELGWL